MRRRSITSINNNNNSNNNNNIEYNNEPLTVERVAQIMANTRARAEARRNPPVANNGLSFFERMQRLQTRDRNDNRNDNRNNITNLPIRPLQQNVINYTNEYNRPNERRILVKETTLQHLLEKSPSIEKEAIEISVNPSIAVYDFEEADNTDVNPFALDNNNIVFKATNTYFQYPRELFEQQIQSMENIIFECKEKKLGAPMIDDIEYEIPYYLLRATGNFIIPLGDIRMILTSIYNVFEIKKTHKHLAHTTAIESIIHTYPYGLLDQEIDIISADHCQAGTERDVYELIPIKFIQNKQKGKGLQFSKTKKIHNFPKVHTLTGSKKNINKKRKSMNKAKKILGINNTR